MHSTVSGDNATDGGLTKQGTGTLTLTGANTFTGATTVNAGTLELGSGGRVYNNGTTAGAVVINNGATLRLSGTDTFGDSGARTPVTFTVNAGGTLAGNGSYNTLNNVTLNGGTISLNGLSNDVGGFAVAGTVTAGGTTASNIADGGGDRFSNYVRLGSENGTNPATFNVTAAGGRLNVAVPLTNNFGGTNGLTKTGTGTLALAGANTYSGPTQVNGGTLLVNNADGSGTGSGAVTVNGGAALGGNGTIAGALAVNNGGTLSPGNSPGRLTLGDNVTLAAGSVLFMELGGAAPGTGGYDQVLSTGGAFTLAGNPTLSLVNGFTPAPMQKFFLLDNATDTALNTGTFANATGTSIQDTAGNLYLLNYADNAGDGLVPNDVSVTFLGTSPIPEPGTYALALLGGLGLLGGVARQRRAARLRV